jgi:DinB family protein
MSADYQLEIERNTEALRSILKSQYHAALAMLRETIERCPDELWFSKQPVNSFWQIAYHSLFFAHVYMLPNEAAFRPWGHHQSDVQNPDGIPGPPDPNSTLPLIPEPYTKEQALAYWNICDEMVDSAVDALDLYSQDSGFSWYKVPKLEHQIVNIRHIEHHTAQLADRLRASEGIGIKWVGARRR